MDKRGTNLSQMISRLNLNHSKILDLGCGNGIYTKKIMKLVTATEAYGIDIKQTSLKEAEKRGITGIRADLNTDRLPFDDDYFDLIIFLDVIEHLLNPDNALKEAYRVLKSRGHFIIMTPNLSSWMNRIYLLFGYQPPDSEVSTIIKFGNPWRGGFASGHIRPFTARALKELLVYHGFIVKHIQSFSHNKGSLPYPLYLLDVGFSKRYTLAQHNLFMCTCIKNK